MDEQKNNQKQKENAGMIFVKYIEKLNEAVRKMAPIKLALLMFLCVMLSAVLLATATMNWGKQYIEGTIYCKDNYSVSDEKAVLEGDTVVASVGEHQLTNSQLQVFYWMELQKFRETCSPESGLDFNQPLDTQMKEESLSWQQYFVITSLNAWQKDIAMSTVAKENGMSLEAERISELRENAYVNGISVKELVVNNVCPGADEEAFLYYQELEHESSNYYHKEREKVSPTQEELEIFYENGKNEFNAIGITRDGMFVDVRHILVQVENGASDEEWIAGEMEAQAILDTWLAGEKSEDSFAVLAAEVSDDFNSRSNGGLYQQVSPGQFDADLNDWCFDESRTVGDYALLKSGYGYHVMYIADRVPQWLYYADYYYRNIQTNQMVGILLSQYPMEVYFENIVLGNVKIS